MAEAARTPRLAEPQVVGCQFVEGIDIEIRDAVIRVIVRVDLDRTEEGN